MVVPLSRYGTHPTDVPAEIQRAREMFRHPFRVFASRYSRKSETMAMSVCRVLPSVGAGGPTGNPTGGPKRPLKAEQCLNVTLTHSIITTPNNRLACTHPKPHVWEAEVAQFRQTLRVDEFSEPVVVLSRGCRRNLMAALGQPNSSKVYRNLLILDELIGHFQPQWLTSDATPLARLLGIQAPQSASDDVQTLLVAIERLSTFMHAEPAATPPPGRAPRPTPTPAHSIP